MIIVSTANVGVDAGELALLEVSLDIFCLLPQHGRKGPIMLAKGERVEGILNTRGEVSVMETVLFCLVPSDSVSDGGNSD